MISKLKIKNGYIFFAFFMLLGLLGTYLFSLGYTVSFYLVFNRMLFGLPFVQLGYLYKTQLEKYDKPSIISVALLIVVQFSLLSFYNNDLSFDMLHGDLKVDFLHHFYLLLQGFGFIFKYLCFW